MNFTKKLFLTIFLSAQFLYLGAQENTIRVASFNLRMDTEKDGLNAWSQRKDFVNHLIQYHDFDIIGTQEGFRHQIDNIIKIKAYTYYGVGRDDGKKAGEHSAIVYKNTKFQLLDSGDFWLREDPSKPGYGWDAICCNRIASWVKLKDKKSGKKFYVFNVHFDHQGVIARKESAKLMIKKIKEIAKDGTAILTGDFNSDPDSEAIKTIKISLQDSYDISELSPYGPVGTFNSFNFTAPMDKRIDFIFVTKNVGVKKYAVLTDFLKQRYPSDHLPVVADIYFK